VRHGRDEPRDARLCYDREASTGVRLTKKERHQEQDLQIDWERQTVSRSRERSEHRPNALRDRSGLRELAHRSNGGFEVPLFWHPATDERTVEVALSVID
jgi:hypothetical protein